MEASIIVIYILTGAVSILIALLLVHLARLSAQAKVKAARLERGKGGKILSDENLKKAILEEVKALEHTKRRPEEITEKVSEIFGRELEKKIDVNAREIAGKYETIVKEKTQNEEIAWKKYKRVLANKKETEAVIRSIAEGLVVIDAKGKVIMMNPAAEKLLGSKKKDKIGKPILENMKKEQLISLVKEDPNNAEDKEIELVSKEDDTKKILRSSSAVVENESGQTVGMVSVLTDITKQKELDELKSSFVSNITHELRTPLVAIQKSITLILSKNAGRLTDTQEHFLSAADRNVKRLSILIDDLLDLSKMEAGRLKLKCETARIEKVVEEVLENLSTWIKTKSIGMVKDTEKGIPDISMDPDRIIQVLNNLIGNAIKFTPENGTIKVGVSLRREKKEICVSVSDNGIGIAKEDLDKIFNRFYQAGERTLTDISGTGIGLAISKEIVELHGGRIWADSSEQGGATFSFTIPLNT